MSQLKNQEELDRLRSDYARLQEAVHIVVSRVDQRISGAAGLQNIRNTRPLKEVADTLRPFVPSI